MPIPTYVLNFTPFAAPQIVQNLATGQRRSVVGFRYIKYTAHWVTAATDEQLPASEWVIFNPTLGEVVL